MHSIKNGNPTSLSSPSALKALFLAARPKTWSASICPVLVGSFLAAAKVPLNFLTLALTLLFSLGIQIGTNYANDYFDFIKGADTNQRVGPKRAVQQGWISPKAMLLASLCAFALALICAAPLMIASGLWSLAIALICAALGILYTGGPTPLGYLGLGELCVFLFFGPVAVMGTYFLQTKHLDPLVFWASLPPALIASAIMTANNLRDEATDRNANKNTIVVRFGRLFGNWVYSLSLCIAALISSFFSPFMLLPYLLALPLARAVFRCSDPLDLMSLLPKTSLLLVLHTLTFCLIVAW